MKLYISHSTKYDYKRDLYEPIRTFELNKQHEFFLPHEDHPDGTYAKNVIRRSDLVIAEASEPATGQGIERGWADAYGVRIVCVSREGSRLSSSLRSVCDQFHTYTDAESFIGLLKKILG